MTNTDCLLYCIYDGINGKFITTNNNRGKKRRIYYRKCDAKSSLSYIVDCDRAIKQKAIQVYMERNNRLPSPNELSRFMSESIVIKSYVLVEPEKLNV